MKIKEASGMKHKFKADEAPKTHEDWSHKHFTKIAVDAADAYRYAEAKGADYFNRFRGFPMNGEVINLMEKIIDYATDEDRPIIQTIIDGVAAIEGAKP